MRLFFDSNINSTSKTHLLNEDESKHIVRVLRMQEGDQIGLLNGTGGSFTCEISTAHPKKCELRVISSTQEKKPDYSIHLAISPTKQSERMEWLIEKATEIGVTEISLINCKNQERSKVKIDRLVKRAISAMKQSHRLFLPKINDLVDIKTFISDNPNGLIAHCYEDSKSSFETAFNKHNCAIMIGPEGDFTLDEIELALQNGYKTITLGENRLRTETAGLYACMRAKIYLDK